MILVTNDPDEFLNSFKMDQDVYIKQLEILMEKRREIANTPVNPDKLPAIIPFPNGSNHPIIDSIELYKDLQERRKSRTCSRCGFYFKYHIEKSTVYFKPHDYGGNEKFWNETFDIVKETILNEGTLDDLHYDVCKKCQHDLFDNKHSTFQRDSNLIEARKEFEHLYELEEQRRKEQSKHVDEVQAEYKAETKERNEKRLKDAEAKDNARRKSINDSFRKGVT